MAGFWNWLIGRGGGNEIIKTIGGVVDDLHHSGEEKAAEKLETQKAEINANLESEKEITKRWVADAQSPITALTRPFIVIYLTLIITIFGALDASIQGFEMGPEWIEIFTWAWVSVLGGFFTLRTIDKRNREKFK